MVFQVQPPTVEQLSVIAMDKFIREEILILAVSKHFLYGHGNAGPAKNSKKARIEVVPSGSDQEIEIIHDK